MDLLPSQGVLQQSEGMQALQGSADVPCTMIYLCKHMDLCHNPWCLEQGLVEQELNKHSTWVAQSG